MLKVTVHIASGVRMFLLKPFIITALLSIGSGIVHAQADDRDANKVIIEGMPSKSTGSTPSSQVGTVGSAIPSQGDSKSLLPTKVVGLLEKSGCTPSPESPCNISVKTSAEFLEIAKDCNVLKGINVIYKPSYVTFTMVGGVKEAGCLFEFVEASDPAKPTKKSCDIKQEELENITSEKAIAAAKAYDLNPQDSSAISNIAKPVMDCVGSIPDRVTMQSLQPQSSQ